MLIIGHRGAGGAYDENTLAAFRHALDSGADGIEFDVRALDGELIVLHDEHLDRTTSGHGHYKDLGLGGVRALTTPRGERVPLLDEVLACANGHALVNVEVKETGIARQVLDALARWRQVHPKWSATLLLSSFDVATTAALGAARGDMRLGVLYPADEGFAGALARASTLHAWSLHLPLDDVSADRVARAHAAGLHVLVYTVNADDDIARCRAAGVDGIFTDHPARICSVPGSCTRTTADVP